MSTREKALRALTTLRTFTHPGDADLVLPLISEIKDVLTQPVNEGIGNLFSECKNFHQCAGLLSTMNFADKHPEHAFYVLNEFIAWFLRTHSDLEWVECRTGQQIIRIDSERVKGFMNTIAEALALAEKVHEPSEGMLHVGTDELQNTQQTALLVFKAMIEQAKIEINNNERKDHE